MQRGCLRERHRSQQPVKQSGPQREAPQPALTGADADAPLECKQSPFQSSGLRKVPGTQQVFNKCIQRQRDRKGKEGEGKKGGRGREREGRRMKAKQRREK